MKYSLKFFAVVAAWFVMLSLIGSAQAQWSQAILERVTSGPENDHLGRSALALDNAGTLHLLYDRWVSGSDHDFYYTVKPLGGAWTYNVPIGDPAANLQYPYLAVDAQSGAAYAVFLQDGRLRLGVGNLEVWSYHDLPVPGSPPIWDPALAVDNQGRAHVAFIMQSSGVYYIGYGYWDGQFHFQLLVNSELGPFGSGAAPSICATSDGGAAISYRGGTYLAYRLDVAENLSLGSTNWTIQTIYQPSYQCYESSLKAAADDHLYLAYSGDMGFGFPGRVFYTHKPDGSTQWAPSAEISTPFSGVDPALAVTNAGVAHIVFPERSGNILTGNICYATNLTGSWAAEYLQQTEKYDPSLVMDANGNGSICFEQYVGSGNQDIYYYGYVQGQPTLPNVTINLTPINPPIRIPAGGGSFSFNAAVTNGESAPQTFDVWIMLQLPNNSWWGPALGPVALTLPGSFTLARVRTQNIPGYAPTGTYTYRGYVGDYNTAKWDSSSFTFEKLGAGDWGTGAGDWTNAGEEFIGGSRYVASLSASGATPTMELPEVSVSPDPFNTRAIASFELRVPSRVSLKIYDTAGRVVATLADGWCEAGTHEAAFDGSGLPSGMYLYRLTAGGTTAAGKMLLLK